MGLTDKLPHLGEFDSKNESSHLGDSRRALLEALQVVLGQQEETLLPPGEQLVLLLPQQSLPMGWDDRNE
jgi:hypothetical protein